MTLRVYLTGPIIVEHEGEVLLREPAFRGRQARLAFAYLALHHRRTVSRSELVALLWGKDMPPPAWEAAVSAVLSRIKSAARALPGTTLESIAGNYRLRLPTATWIDVDAALDALDGAEGAIRRGDCKSAYGRTVVASMIARRPFLADIDLPWAADYRARLRRVLLRSLVALSEIWLAIGDANLAIESALDLLSEDPLNERGYQLLMGAHAAAGQPADAIAAYRRLRDALRSDLGTQPSPNTEAIYRALLG